MSLNSARQVRGEKYVGRNGWEDEESVITNYHFCQDLGR